MGPDLLSPVLAIAPGDALGSSFLDSTLSIGSGPLVNPAAVTARTAVLASVYSLAAIAIVTVALVLCRMHDRRSGVLLLALYAAAYGVVIAG